MTKGILLKTVDIAVFTVLSFFLIRYSRQDPNTFDLLSIVTLAYVMIRRPDVNTVSLGFIILVERAFDSIVFMDYQTINAYLYYFSLFVINIVMVLLMWFRPLWLSRISPNKLGQNKGLALTHQDMLMCVLFFIQAVFQLTALLEHILRHLDDFGLASVVDVEWWNRSARILYNNYETMQLVFSTLGIVIMFFMTFDVSKYGAERRVVGHRESEMA